MAARFHDLTLVEDDEPVHFGQRRQAVRDRDHRLAFHQREQIFLNRRLDFRVERRGRLIKYQDRRVLEEHAGNGDTLTLATGQLYTAFAHLGIETLAAMHIDKRFHEVPGIRPLCRRDHLLVGGLGMAIGDVVADRTVQQRSILRHHTNQLAQAVLRHLGDVLPVDGDLARFQIVETQEQVHQRRLARTGTPDQTDLLARLDIQRQPVDHALVLAVVEADVIITDRALRCRKLRRLRSIDDIVRLRHHRHAVIDGADVFEQRGDFPHDPLRHAVDAHGKAYGNGNRAGRDRTLHPEIKTERGRGKQHDRIVEVDQDVEAGNLAHLAVNGSEKHVHALTRISFLATRMRKQLDRRDVCIAVDDTPRHHRARIGLLLCEPAEFRHEIGEDTHIDAEPHQQRNDQPPVCGRNHEQHRDDEADSVDEHVDHLQRHFADRQRRLHHLGRNPACKFVGEKVHGVAQQETMHLPARDHAEIAGKRLVHRHGVDSAHQWQQEEHQPSHDHQMPALIGKKRLAIGRGKPVNDAAEEFVEHGLRNGDAHGHQAEQQEPRPCGLHIMPHERQKLLRRHRRRRRGKRIKAFFKPAKHRPSSGKQSPHRET